MGLALKLWILLTVPLVVGFAVYGWLAHENRQRVLLTEASAELRNYATLVEVATERAAREGDTELVQRRIEGLAQADRVLGIATFSRAGAPGLLTEDLSSDRSKEELGRFVRHSVEGRADLEAWLSLSGRPVLVRSIQGPERPFVTVVVRDMSYLSALSVRLNRGLALMAALVIALAAAATGLVARLLVGRPVAAIVAGVERVAGGDLEAKVPEPGTRELAWLARAFNAMTSSLAEARREAERQASARAAVEREVRHAQALAAVGQVAASVAHEIGSPLNVILGRSLRSAGRASCDPDSKGEFETIASQCERISKVVRQLLSTARPPRDEPGACDLVAVAREALEFLAPEARARGIETKLDATREPGIVALDRDRVFQVLLNLCLNAAQAQRQGGRIEVRVARDEPKEGGRGRVILEVDDAGPGIPPDQQEHVFEAFFTSRQGEGGTGLGLAVVRGIVREAGGTIELVPKETPGARFRVVLPAA